MTSNFRDDLTFSNSSYVDQFWMAFYTCFFGSFTWETVLDLRLQAKGVDRILTLSGGRKVYIEEKMIRKSYPNFVLEYISNNQTRSPGWMEKPLQCDYIAYGIQEENTGYLLSYPILMRVWRQYRKEWIDNGERRKDGFLRSEGKNDTYTTYCVAVPRDILLGAMQRATRAEFRR